MSSVNDLRIRQKDQTPKLAIALLAVIAIISVYIVGYDQGQLLTNLNLISKTLRPKTIKPDVN